MANQDNRGGTGGTTKDDTQGNRSTGRPQGGDANKQSGNQGRMNEPGRDSGRDRERREPGNRDDDRSRKGEQGDGTR